MSKNCHLQIEGMESNLCHKLEDFEEVKAYKIRLKLHGTASVLVELFL